MRTVHVNWFSKTSAGEEPLFEFVDTLKENNFKERQILSIY